jgi:hypothetical protein
MFVEVLVREKIGGGQAVLDALRDSDFPVTGAFWCKIPESGYWRLVIASPRVREAGLLASVHEVRLILEAHGLGSQYFTDIFLFSPKDPEYVRLFEHAFGANRFGAPISAAAYNRTFEDAWLYFA